MKLTGLIAALGCALVAVSTSVASARPAAEPVQVQVLSISDFHGYLQPPTPGQGGEIPGPDGTKLTVGGAAYIATHLKRLREGHENSVFLAAGDQFAGWPFEVDVHQDEPTVEVLNQMDLELDSVGNHELDVSPWFLTEHMGKGTCFGRVGIDSCFTDSTGAQFKGADFDFSTGNIVRRSDGSPFVPPYVVKDFNGTKVGIISLTVGDTPTGSTSYQPGLKSLDPVETADKYAAELKSKGVNAIVLSIHDGAAPKDPNQDSNACNLDSGPLIDVAARASADIDAIVAGHWHLRFNCSLPDPDGNPRPVVEPGNHGQLINEITLSIDPATGEVDRTKTKSVNHPVTRDVAADPAAKQTVDYWAAEGKKRYGRVIGTADGEFTTDPNAVGESTMGDLVADMQYWVASRTPEGTADLALVQTKPHTGSNAIHGNLQAGEVQEGRAWERTATATPS